LATLKEHLATLKMVATPSLRSAASNYFIEYLFFTRKRRDGVGQRQRAGREVEDHRNVDESIPEKVDRVISNIILYLGY
jgi:hypothetical protein